MRFYAIEKSRSFRETSIPDQPSRFLTKREIVWREIQRRGGGGRPRGLLSRPPDVHVIRRLTCEVNHVLTLAWVDLHYGRDKVFNPDQYDSLWQRYPKWSNWTFVGEVKLDWTKIVWLTGSLFLALAFRLNKNGARIPIEIQLASLLGGQLQGYRQSARQQVQPTFPDSWIV